MGKNPKIMKVDNKNKLKILFVPAWYPSKANPLEGIFVKEQAKAVSLHNDVTVLFASFSRSSEHGRHNEISDEVEDGIRTLRVEYGGWVHFWAGLLLRKKGAKGTSPDLKIKGSQLLLKPIGFLLDIILSLQYYWIILSTFKQLIKRERKPDIIHAHVYSAGVPAVIIGEIYKIPVIITEHYSGFRMHSLTYVERIKARFAFKRAQIILPVSDDLGSHIRAYGVQNHFKTVPNPVNTKTFYYYPDHNNKPADKVKKLLLVAILRPVKGVPYLLQALSKLKEKRDDFRLDILGDGPNKTEYEKLSTNLELDSTVKFHGYKPHEEVAQFMRCCDVYVLPSVSDNLPGVIVEAMACGKPVIATDSGGSREMVNEKVGILVPPKDSDALQKAIEYMLDNYQNYSAEAISHFAKERFSYESVGKVLDETYRNLLSNINNG